MAARQTIHGISQKVDALMGRLDPQKVWCARSDAAQLKAEGRLAPYYAIIPMPSESAEKWLESVDGV